MIKRIFWNVVILWICALMYTIVTVNYPTTCKLSRDHAQYSTLCLEPLFGVTSTLNISLFIGTSGQSAIKVWEFNEYRNGDEIKQDIHVEIPHSVRLESKDLIGWFIFSQIDKGIYGEERRAVVPVSLTLLKVVKVDRAMQRNLLTESSVTTSGSPPREERQLQHWKYGHSRLSIVIVNFWDLVLGSNVLSTLGEMLRVHGIQRINNDESSQQNQVYYEPVFFVDDLSLTSSQIAPLSRNVSMPNPRLRLKISSIHPLFFAAKKILLQTLHYLSALIPEDDLDDFRTWLSDEMLFRFLLSQMIIWVHILLEYLAFNQDLKFYVGRKNFSGISTSSTVAFVVRSLIMLLYLMDAGASTIILFSIAKDVLFGTYKLTKLLNVKISGTLRLSWRTIADLTDGEKATNTYDKIAVDNVSLCLFPAIIGYAIYALIFYRYKSWWSWTVSCLADSVYFFGFIAMTPQLYINYKLQSVAHLPLRAMLFKFFSTFIDDVFAFLVTMPLKHRIMTLRDDFIYLVFVYQWLMYPVDRSRPNEFGYQYETRNSRD